jgi:hypothetical protein
MTRGRGRTIGRGCREETTEEGEGKGRGRPRGRKTAEIDLGIVGREGRTREGIEVGTGVGAESEEDIVRRDAIDRGRIASPSRPSKHLPPATRSLAYSHMVLIFTKWVCYFSSEDDDRRRRHRRSSRKDKDRKTSSSRRDRDRSESESESESEGEREERKRRKKEKKEKKERKKEKKVRLLLLLLTLSIAGWS